MIATALTISAFMSSIIVGTAGHIDHGKTTLVHALTGIDTDRLAEEKRRGISIELGFAHLDLGAGPTAAFVDVPGHERFVKTMVAGVTGIDLVLLIISALAVLLISSPPRLPHHPAHNHQQKNCLIYHSHLTRFHYNTATFSHDTVCDCENSNSSALRESTTPAIEIPEAETGQLRGKSVTILHCISRRKTAARRAVIT